MSWLLSKVCDLLFFFLTYYFLIATVPKKWYSTKYNYCMRMIPQAIHENQFYLVTMLYKRSNTYSSQFRLDFLNLVNVDKS